MQDYDVMIGGGGLVGGSLACALAQTRLRVALVEAVPAGAVQQPSYDERVIALGLGSRRILDAIRLWPTVAPEAEPIRQVRISDRGQFGAARLDHEDMGVPALGYVAPARILGEAIQAGLAAASNLEIFRPARIERIRVESDGVEVGIQAGAVRQSLRARLLVGADGGDSAIRRQLAPEVRERLYGQEAVIATLTASRPLRGVAFERFTDTGPLAFLPMTQGRYSVVWTSSEAETPGLLALDDAAFLARLRARFGGHLGDLVEVSPRRAYPLKLLLTPEPAGERLVLIGNAAHTLHPVAGQGFNLGLRDVAALAESLAWSAERGEDPGGSATLAEYRRWRGRDQATTGALTDSLIWLFGNPWPPLRLARGLGLLGLDLLPGARTRVARRFMGLAGPLPRLARGLPLDAHFPPVVVCGP